jgi:hypothetical protein
VVPVIVCVGKSPTTWAYWMPGVIEGLLNKPNQSLSGPSLPGHVRKSWQDFPTIPGLINREGCSRPGK